jgi:hypothetical protein
MIPTWAAVVGAVSLVVIALAALTVAVALVFAALAARRLFHAVQMLAGPAVSDVRHLVGSIRAEADALVGTSRDIRLVSSGGGLGDRLADLDALAEVVQEVEDGPTWPPPCERAARDPRVPWARRAWPGAGRAS